MKIKRSILIVAVVLLTITLLATSAFASEKRQRGRAETGSVNSGTDQMSPEFQAHAEYLMDHANDLQNGQTEKSFEMSDGTVLYITASDGEDVGP